MAWQQLDGDADFSCRSQGCDILSPRDNNSMTERSNPRGPLVLVVSAESTLRQTRTLLLEGAGYKVVAAESRHKASQIAQQFDFDVAILDHTLDKRDRIRLVRLVRELAPATRILVLHKSGADCGADLCLDSREGPEQVISSVKMLLEGPAPGERQSSADRKPLAN
jgi:CheY-like chemotaxis protein